MCVTICDYARPPPPIPPFLAIFKTDCPTLIVSWMMSALVNGSQRINNTPPTALLYDYIVAPCYSKSLKCGHLVLMDVLQLYIRTPEMRILHYSIKQTGFSASLVPGLSKFTPIVQTLACLSWMVVHHHWSTQQLDIIIAMMSMALPSSYSFSYQRTARESSGSHAPS